MLYEVQLLFSEFTILSFITLLIIYMCDVKIESFSFSKHLATCLSKMYSFISERNILPYLLCLRKLDEFMLYVLYVVNSFNSTTLTLKFHNDINNSKF